MSNNRKRGFVHRRSIEIGSVIAIIAVSGTGQADNSAAIPAGGPNTPPPFVSTAVERPWTFRVDLGFPYPPSGFGGFTIGYTILGRVAIEYSNGTFGKAWVQALMIRPRLHLTQESSVFVGGGSSYALFFGDEQTTGRVFADGEVGYEFRGGTSSSITYLVAVGMYYHIVSYEYPPSSDPGFVTIPRMVPYGRVGVGWTR